MVLRKKLILIIFYIVLATFSVMQFTIDYMNEKKINGHSSEVVKRSEYLIFIELEEHTLYLLQDNEVIKKYLVASGKPKTPSPIGNWKIISKGTWGGGFGGRWMGLNVPWGKYGIHGTNRPNSIGWAVSHGCIRMRNKDVEELYKIVPHGTRVIIVNGPFGPFGKGFRNLEPGDRGTDVMEVQRRLKELGFFKGWVSGIYSDDLKTAVHSFQKENKLPVKNAITRDDYNAMGFREFE